MGGTARKRRPDADHQDPVRPGARAGRGVTNDLVRAHISGQAGLRAVVGAAVGQAWNPLPAPHEENVDEFLARVLPIAAAGQRSSVTLTEAFLARRLDSRPIGIDP